MNSTIIKPSGGVRETKAEVQQMREAAQRIASSKKLATRFLASTGMHKANGQLKPRFR